MRCDYCGLPLSESTAPRSPLVPRSAGDRDVHGAWLRIGPHAGKRLVRLIFHYECGEKLAEICRANAESWTALHLVRRKLYSDQEETVLVLHRSGED